MKFMCSVLSEFKLFFTDKNDLSPKDLIVFIIISLATIFMAKKFIRPVCILNYNFKIIAGIFIKVLLILICIILIFSFYKAASALRD